jgi:predicted DNA-binding antitoxin AbrB/MazE fold protein
MNRKTVQAVYESGVFRPLEQLDLPEQIHVKITIDRTTQSVSEAVGSCYDLADKAGMIGALHGGPSDLSSNPDHLTAFGSA